MLQFLEHYRSIGVGNFVIVDDHSDDGTAQILAAQDDVTIYTPKAGSSYRQDKIDWRCDLLDSICDQRWVLLADIDEHLIYPQVETKDLAAFCRLLDAEGAQAVFTVMVDMYADKPLKDHQFTKGSLAKAFPFFDCPNDPAVDYRLMPPAKRFLKRFPTPAISAYGGLRDRLFFSDNLQNSAFSNWLLRKFAKFDRPLNPSFFQRIGNSLARQFTKKRFGSMPLSMTKISLVKWQSGMKLPGGPHAVSHRMVLSQTTAAFLHFSITDGVKGVKYVAQRGQHAGNSVIYNEILNKVEIFDLAPMAANSRRYDGPQSLIDCGLMRADFGEES